MITVLAAIYYKKTKNNIERILEKVDLFPLAFSKTLVNKNIQEYNQIWTDISEKLSRKRINPRYVVMIDEQFYVPQFTKDILGSKSIISGNNRLLLMDYHDTNPSIESSPFLEGIQALDDLVKTLPQLKYLCDFRSNDFFTNLSIYFETVSRDFPADTNYEWWEVSNKLYALLYVTSLLLKNAEY